MAPGQQQQHEQQQFPLSTFSYTTTATGPRLSTSSNQRASTGNNHSSSSAQHSPSRSIDDRQSISSGGRNMSGGGSKKHKHRRSDSSTAGAAGAGPTSPLSASDARLNLLATASSSAAAQQQLPYDQDGMGEERRTWQQRFLPWVRAPPRSRYISFPDGFTRRSLPPNVIKNQKYTALTFLPLVLIEQFKFFFNLYFLLVALSQLIPALQIGYLFTYFAPLGFVLAVTITKEAVDDYKRYKRDCEANGQFYEQLTPSGIQRVPSSKVKVGDIILVHKNQRVPADMVLLRTTEKSGGCFIRTDQLDGETDWKLRLAVGICQQLPSDQSMFDLRGIVYADQPQKDIYTFQGNFRKFASGFDDQERTEPLSVENTLWTNTVVASGTAVGLVVYTGTDTRAVMNTSHPSTKVGLLDHELNLISKILCLVTFLLAFILIALNQFAGLWYIYLMRFLIIFSSIIPISLRVNLDMGKTVYAWQIMRDRDIPDTIVRTSTIPEELGRIEYLLSDKTGTLTKNDMELKKLHMGTMSYGVETMDEVRKHLKAGMQNRQAEMAINQQGQGNSASSSSATSSFNRRRNSTASPVHPNPAKFTRYHRDISSRITDIVQALALCHNVTPVSDEDAAQEDVSVSHDSTVVDLETMKRGAISYQASSPDEVAIVKWTESVGLTLVYRDMTTIRLRWDAIDADSMASETFSYEILNVFPFTSETKRMGIIVRDVVTNQIYFYMKGADTVMAKIVQYNDWLDEECGNMAREGLRTLVIARRKLSDDYYQEFESQYHRAKISVTDRNQQVQNVISHFLENDLELLGLTGVEDKLQDDVKTTLEILRNAGLKIWMLTGDKVETATNIAISSKLVARNQSIYHIQKIADFMAAEDELSRLGLQQADCCLVIDGQSLQFYLDHYRDQFIEMAVAMPCVVCCRCSPTQKAAVTTLIKDHTKKRVCAIGDGGNDVSMIQSADVGLGIVGKEGKQASLAADFSITQFSHITRLFLWHGRNSYKRSAKLSQFVIHRGLIISIIQAVFSAIFYFAPIALYQGMMLVGYSTVYTMAPVFSLVLDKDVSAEIALMYPELYKELTKGRSLSLRTFFTWLLISLYQGGIIMMLALWLFEDEFIHIVSITFTALIFNELIMVALEIHTWHPFMIYAEVVTVFFYLLSMVLLKTEFDLSFILTWRFVWKTAVITLFSSFPLYIIKVLKKRYAPSSYSKLQ